MNDERFDNLIKQKLKQEIEIPEDLNNIVINNINKSNIKEKTKLNTAIIRLIQGIISLLTIALISGGVYAGVTGNSVLNMLGLKKASENYEQTAFEINKKIEDSNVTVSLNKLACDNSFLILEYDIEFTEEGLKNIDYVINQNKLSKDETFFEENTSDDKFYAENEDVVNPEEIDENDDPNVNIISVTTDENDKTFKNIITPTTSNDNYTTTDEDSEDFFIEDKSAIDYSGTSKIDINKEYIEDDKEKIELSGGVYVNGRNAKEYASYTEKMSEGKYKLYNIIIMDNKETNFKVEIGAYCLLYNNLILRFDESSCFFLDFSLKRNIADNVVTEKKFENINLKINKIVDSEIATIGHVKLEINGVDKEQNNLNNLSLGAVDKNGKELNIDTIIMKDRIITENDEYIELMNNYDSADEEEMNDAKNIKYKNGTAYIDMILIFREGVNDSKKIKIYPKENEKKIGEGIEVDIYKQPNDNVQIKEIKVDSSSSDQVFQNMSEVYEQGKETNKYYTENAKKINLKQFKIHGLQIGMTPEEALSTLQKKYDENNINIKCGDISIEDKIGYYSDDYVSLGFYKQQGMFRLIEVNFNDVTLNNKYKITEKDVISKFYSEEECTILTQSVYDYKVLYGKDGVIAKLKEEKVDGDYAYIFREKGRDSYINYYNNKILLMIDFNFTTKVVKSMSMGYEEEPKE